MGCAGKVVAVKLGACRNAGTRSTGTIRAPSCVDYSDTTAWFLARNRVEEYELLRVFFDSTVVREGLGELQIPTALIHGVGGFQELPPSMP